MRLKQHVDFPTHRDGNLLDLIITDDLMKDNIVSCSRGDLASVHCVIFGELLWEPPQNIQIKASRNFRNTNISALSNDL